MHISTNGWNILFPALLIVFITLKLTGYIAWSWLWVLAPLWIPIIIGLIFLVIFLIAMSRARSPW